MRNMYSDPLEKRAFLTGLSQTDNYFSLQIWLRILRYTFCSMTEEEIFNKILHIVEEEGLQYTDSEKEEVVESIERQIRELKKEELGKK